MLTLKQKMRLKSLLAKSAMGDLSDDESSELATLKSLAQEASFDPVSWEPSSKDLAEIEKEKQSADDGDGDNGNGEAGAKEFTDDELKDAVGDAVEKTLKAGGLTADSMIDKVVKSIKDSEGDKLTGEQIAEAVKKQLGDQVSEANLIAAIKENMPKDTLTEEKVEKMFDTFAKSIRRDSKMAHGTGSADRSGGTFIEFPVEHRSGNLSVAQKQLLNLCLMHQTADAVPADKKPRHMNEGIPDSLLQKALATGNQRLARITKSAQMGRKAITTGGSGTGAEWVDTELSTTLMERFYLASDLAQELIQSEVQMPSDPFKYPLATTRPTFYTGSEGGTADESTPGTGDVTLTTAKLIGYSQYSYEADEDSIVAVLPQLQAGMVAEAAAAFEDAVINGDSDGTHQDSDYQAVTRHAAKAFDGLRKHALAVGALTKDLSASGITAAGIGSMRSAMGKYGINNDDLMLVVGPAGYNDLILLSETLTADKVGSDQARILTGQSPSIFGIRVVVSAKCREDLNTSGVYDGTTTDNGSILLVNRPHFLVGVKRGFTVEVDRNITTQMNQVVASFRRAFEPVEDPSATIQTVVIGHNWDSSS